MCVLLNRTVAFRCHLGERGGSAAVRVILRASGACLAVVAVLLILRSFAAPAMGISLGASVHHMAFVILAVRPNIHPTRTRILQHLRNLPGDHLRSIARTLRISLGGARYHLHVLHRGGLVREDKVRHRARYYSLESAPQAEKNAVFAKHWEHRDIQVRILRAVESQGTTGPSQVARQMGISRQLATYHLGQLTVSGKLTREAGTYRHNHLERTLRERAAPGFPPELRR